ncbi:MarR family winged helix-turn-helix transcriptional regulator [Nakamurella deserti]|uniref:MarR family winged helix-turn-helix transcriptional regulator n=1 Tax=Nakamurella deserti TaxID=2164074 RepID=UPI000DBE3D31|nr:MarR family winged helix-turn-helix transcriptional regulator [Nakamurella deserti]
MEAGRLYRLIRQLRSVAGAATGDSAETVSPSIIAVMEDLAEHPDSSITEIVGRTGLVQSMVSTAVAQLRSDGVLRTTADPRDRRRTLVSMVPSASDGVVPRPGRSVDDALRQVRPELDDDRRAEVVRHLEQVAALLEH